MPLAWNEIRHRAIKFAHDWAEAASESADKQTFWNEFLNVFGIRRPAVASFEEAVRMLSRNWGRIDLFWKGVLLAEHKSRGESLDKAAAQAFDYIQALVTTGRQNEIPRYVIVSDFARVVLYDLEPDEQKELPPSDRRRARIVAEFPLQEFHKHLRAFAFIAGYQLQKLDPEDPANLEAAKIMANLHDALKAGNYAGHELRVFLVRILFCLFAEDTGIFGQPRQFELYLINHTAADGSDLGTRLARLFELLNTPDNKRQTRLDADLAEFPYVNGDLFKEHLAFADFNSDMRNALLAACAFRWEKISPAVFGSLFQEVMLPKERRQLGAHFTAEKNILKVIRSLFLDDWRAELDAIRADRSTRRAARLEEFHARLAALRFFDPACGCGNFIVITYRELRVLELEVLLLKHGAQHEMSLDDVNKLSRIDVDQMFGIEIEEFPARIAEVALWLTDHQMNLRLSEAFSQFYIRIPLRKSPHIHVGNALRMDWKQVLAPEKCSYLLGNPPFVGKHYQSKEQRADLVHVFRDFKNTGDIDYVVAWFYRAAEYVQGTKIKVGFVATNSITQGEQVPLVWGLLFDRFKVKIHFAHRTFPWESEARGKAHVHVVIIGFAVFDAPDKRIYDHEGEKITVTPTGNISPYLTPGPDLFVTKRSKPLCDVPDMRCGNKPSDDGNLILTDEEKVAFLKEEPAAKKFLRRFTGSEEFINGDMRWCLWLQDATPAELDALPRVMERVARVKEFRLRSTAEPTRAAAKTPAHFFFRSQPSTKFIAIPEVSSERREYIPIGFVRPEIIVSNKIYLIASPSRFHFGVLSSAMHMAWVKQIAGRLESRFQYSGSMVYNNYPWPVDASSAQKEAVEEAARSVLDARQEFPDSTLAQLYDPLKMPLPLRKAHDALDRAVDRCYRKEPFPSDRARVEYLFQLYEQLTAPLLAAAQPKRARRAKGLYALPPPAPAPPIPTPKTDCDAAAHYYMGKEDTVPYRTKPPED